MEPPDSSVETVPLVRRAGTRGRSSQQQSGQRRRPCVLFGRLPLLPLRIIHDFLLPSGTKPPTRSALVATTDVTHEAKGSFESEPGQHPSTAKTAFRVGEHAVLFCLSSRLAFQFQDAVECKEFFTATTVRNTLQPKELRKFVKAIHKAQLLIRTELKIHQWGERDYAKYHFGINYTCGFQDNTPRVRAESEEDFLRQHEALQGVPVVVLGLTEKWPAQRKWKLHRLNRMFGGMKWRVGDDDDGYPVDLRMVSYFWYTQHIAPYEDNPLYLFDSSFEDSKVRSKVLTHYQVPELFSDQFDGIRESVRPPYRWLLIGPPRSGSGIHHDPLATSAWNTCVFGHKRWVLFHPSTPREIVRPNACKALWPGHIGGAIAWFQHVYPLTRDKSTWGGGNPLYQAVEILQGPGETVFIPTGWWHVVVNLDYTVAVTQNFAEKRNHARVRRKMKKRRKDIYREWLRSIDAPDSDPEAPEDAEYDSGWDSSSTSTSSSTDTSSNGNSSSDESSNAVRSLVESDDDTDSDDE